MRGKHKEPTESEVGRIAESILSYRPLAVVLTGGDPLLSPHLSIVLETLYKRTGIIIDTSGVTFNNDTLELFRRYDVFVRISFDSEIPHINDDLRPSINKNSSSSESAINTLCQCIDKGIGVSVQTVVSKYNRSDLEILGDKLFRMGVRSWRILMMTHSKVNEEHIKLLKGSESSQKRFDHYIEKQLRTKHENGWNKGMGVQITHNRTPNSVILVAPDGVFLTELKVRPGKVILDEKRPKEPRLHYLFMKVDPYAHAERYLNL